MGSLCFFQPNKNDSDNTIAEKIITEFISDYQNLKETYIKTNKMLEKELEDFKLKYGEIIPISILLKDIVEEKDDTLLREKVEEFYTYSYNGKNFSDICEISIDDKGFCSVNLKDEKLFQDNLYIYQMQIKKHDCIFLNNSNFVKNLFTLYENFGYKIKRLKIKLYPQKYLTKETISFSELDKIGFDKNETIYHFINELTKDFTKNSDLKSYCEKLNVEFERFRDEKEFFNEIYYRRNILTHGDGHLSNDYKNKVSKKLKEKYTRDDRLIFNDEYIHNCYETIMKVSLKLFFVAIQEYDVANGELLKSIADLIFGSFLYVGEWSICKDIYNYLRNLHEIDKYDLKDLFRVNYMICLKQLNETKELNNQLKSYSTVNKAMRFKIAKKLIANDYQNINEEIEKCYTLDNKDEDKEKITPWAILTWPLFMEYRQTEYFKKFVEKHKEEFLNIRNNLVELKGI